MKIGILTFHRPANFGANLQAYSSFKYLTSKGHCVKVLDFVRDADLRYRKTVSESQLLSHKEFVENRLPLTDQAINQDQLLDIIAREKFDGIIIGADAVWRISQDIDVFFGKLFLDNSIPVASMSAAHMGNGFSELEIQQKEIIRQCLMKFSFISVRDSWTMNCINKDIFGGEKIVTVLNPDPVFMLSDFTEGEQWNSNGMCDKQYYLMTLPKDWASRGILSQKKIKWFTEFKQLVNNAGYSLVELPLPEGISRMNFDYTIDYPIDPIEWFLWIKHAKAFCGLRFHAIVSSISCATPFYSIDSYGDSSRLSMILDLLGFHKTARKRDINSKIRNLLLNSSFANNRTGSFIEFESPIKIFLTLENIDTGEIKSFRDRNKSVFEVNIDKIIKSFGK